VARLTVASPVGPLTLVESGGALTVLAFADQGGRDETPLLREARSQLAAYFEGRRSDFDLPLAPTGTPFQRRVWAAMARIPHGETRTYGALARAVGSAPRAVGGACGRNPLPIIVPCHRVVAGAGGLGGYSGGRGAATKRALLALENPAFGEPPRRSRPGPRDNARSSG